MQSAVVERSWSALVAEWTPAVIALDKERLKMYKRVSQEKENAST